MHRPIEKHLCSSALKFCYIRPKGQTYGLLACLLACLLANDCRRLVIPCQLLLPVFRIFFAGYSALKVPRINIRYVLSFIFYHNFLKKSSLYVLTSCEITKIQKFTHNSFLFTHFRYLSALPLCKNVLTFTNHTKLPTPVILVKRSGSLFENHSPAEISPLSCCKPCLLLSDHK